MASILKNTANTGTSYLGLPKGSTTDRPKIYKKVETFTTAETTSWTAPSGVTEVELLVVAGGGGGGTTEFNDRGAGGGGAGGLIYDPAYSVTAGQSYTVTVGAGGAGGTSGSSYNGVNGGNSVFDSLTAIGGGGGAGQGGTPAGRNGGSGGGGRNSGGGGAGTPGQGYPGGTSTNKGGGAGGGAGGPGGDHIGAIGGGGGPGLPFAITGEMSYYAGGGGAGTYGDNDNILGGGGGSGVGGAGGKSNDTTGTGFNAVANTGSGGGGGGCGIVNDPSVNPGPSGGNGADGIVVIRYLVVETGYEDPKGSIRYNTDFNDIEIFESISTGWKAQNVTKNFSAHNVVKWSENTNYFEGVENVSITESAEAPPEEISTASVWQFADNSTSGRHRVYSHQYTNTTETISIGSVYAKQNTARYITVMVSNNGARGPFVNADLQTGTIVDNGVESAGTYLGGGIEDVGDGWYRIYVVSEQPSGDTGFYLNIGVANQADISGIQNYSGSGDSFYIAGPQLEIAKTIPSTYIKTYELRSLPPYRSGKHNVHKYTDRGKSTFVPECSGEVEVLVVAGGGGGGGGYQGSGGGAGGVLHKKRFNVVGGYEYEVFVGFGGNGTSGTSDWLATNGEDSRFGYLTAVGGGAGSTQYSPGGDHRAHAGGSGGGGNHSGGLERAPGVQGQGNLGGLGSNDVPHAGGGGGGAGSHGGAGVDDISNYTSNGRGGDGGSGVPIDITGDIVYYGGGGAGSCRSSDAVFGGVGGGGSAGGDPGDSGDVNTGGGGGAGRGADYGGSNVGTGGSGGSGIVVVRYQVI